MSDRGHALVLVRTGVAHDARVRRAAGVLADAGWRPVIVGSVTPTAPARRELVGGIPVLRLAARSPVRRLRDRLRGVRQGAQAAVIAPATPGLGPVRRLPHPMLRAHRLLTTWDWNRQAYGALRALRPELVHCNDYNTMWVGVAARLRGIPVVYDSHELWPDRNGRPESRPWLMLCEALFVRAASAVLTTSPGYARAMAARYRVPPPILVRNLPDAGVAPASRRDAPGDPPVVVYVGGVMPGRGIEEAIAALPHAGHARLLVIGPGRPEEVAAVRARAARAGVGDRVTVCPAVPHEQLVATIRSADAGLCLIQPVCRSYELTLPNKLYEYAAAGLPIVASDLPVIARVVRESGAGVIVPAKDPQALGAALLALFESETWAATAARAQRLGVTETWQRERDRLRAVYERVAPAR